jgi:hypothetical protein
MSMIISQRLTHPMLNHRTAVSLSLSRAYHLRASQHWGLKAEAEFIMALIEMNELDGYCASSGQIIYSFSAAIIASKSFQTTASLVVGARESCKPPKGSGS